MQPAAQREACPVCCVSGKWCGLAKHKTDPQNNIQMEIPNMLYELNQNILCNFIPINPSLLLKYFQYFIEVGILSQNPAF